MSYNPRIKNISGGTVDISGSLAATNVSTYVSASNANIATVVANSISASTVDSGTSLDITLKSVKSSIRKVTSGTSVQTTDSVILVDAASGSVGLTLPSASLVPGQRFTVKKVDSTGNIVSIYPQKSSSSSSYYETDILSGSLAVTSGDGFGYSVSLNDTGDKMAVGAYQDESTGRVYVFSIINNIWIQEKILSGSLSTSDDMFGYKVLMNPSGNTIFVGVPFDEKALVSSTGLVYVFTSGSFGWTETAVLSGSRAIDASDSFGYSISLNSSGNRLVVGALTDDRASGGTDCGLAYVFSSGSGGWIETAILSGTLASGSGDYFGFSVSINSNGDRVVVGARQDERSSQVTTRNEGLAYVFVSSSGGWSQDAILSGTLATDANDYFGCAVSINSVGDRLVVGALQDERSGGAASSGLAYVYNSGSTGWTQNGILSGTLATGSADYFGYSVLMNSSGNKIIIGAQSDEIPSASAAYQNSGLVYVFTSGSSGWFQSDILSGSGIQVSDYFGSSLAINSSGDKIIIGSYEDEPLTASNAASWGTVYVFSQVQTVDSAGKKSLSSQNESVTVISDGTGSWSII
jgi:hypothetical protein